CGPLVEVLRPCRSQRARAECLPRILDGRRGHLLYQLSLHRMREAADQRRHSQHLLRPWLSGLERPARSLPESGRDPDPPYRVVTDPTAPVGTGQGLAEASTAAGSPSKETLSAGWGRAGRAAADGSRTAHAIAATAQRRQEVPTQEQRTGWAAPTRRRRADPAAPSGCYRSGGVSTPGSRARA